LTYRRDDKDDALKLWQPTWLHLTGEVDKSERFHVKFSQDLTHTHTHTHTHPFNGPLSGTTQVSQYQKGKTNLDFTGARESEWQWNPLGHMQVCISHQTGNHASTPLLSFLQAGCPSSAQPTVSKQTYQNH